MKKCDDFLVEIHTEELPPKSLLKLAAHFKSGITERLEKNKCDYEEAVFYATPRRLAVCVKQLAAKEKDSVVEKRGPQLKAAYDAAGEPTKACLGFAKSLNIDVGDLAVISTEQGEWVGYKESVTGKSVADFMPPIVEETLRDLPIAKRMRWGKSDIEFVRPVHAVIMLYGKDVVHATILGCETDRKTRGHRFLSPNWLSIPSASEYEKTLEKKGHVMVDVEKRRALIESSAKKLIKKGEVLQLDHALLDEVCGLVEWPEALRGEFEKDFLRVPKEALISAMQDHQRYFPITDSNNHLTNSFIMVSNIQSKEVKRVVQGNERVLRARLSDAAFFFDVDQKTSLENRLASLKNMIYQAKLGSLFERAERLSALAGWIACQIGSNVSAATRAGLLAKSDLTTQMVGEFPELQGIMGGYYARHDGEDKSVALAISEQYMPLGASGALPTESLSLILALADRIDLLVGSFGMNQLPTGDKDPYGLRRAAIAIIRLIIEKKIKINFLDLLRESVRLYDTKLTNKETVSDLMQFVQDRMRGWYQDQHISPDVFAAVAVLPNIYLLEMHEKILAVSAFKKMPEAANLSAANKRVSNILSKFTASLCHLEIDSTQFEHAAEKLLAQKLHEKQRDLKPLINAASYDQVLISLAELKSPIDDFFLNVMVMSDDPKKRDNRILLLKKIRDLFLQVADIALLQ